MTKPLIIWFENFKDITRLARLLLRNASEIEEIFCVQFLLFACLISSGVMPKDFLYKSHCRGLIELSLGLLILSRISD